MVWRAASELSSLKASGGVLFEGGRHGGGGLGVFGADHASGEEQYAEAGTGWDGARSFRTCRGWVWRSRLRGPAGLSARESEGSRMTSSVGVRPEETRRCRRSLGRW